MKLSLRGEYALRALVVLGLNYHGTDEAVVRIQTISDQQNIPKRFLEQILNDLRTAGMVESKRGLTGGYRLKRDPNEITLAEVIRHIEGPLAPVSCVSEYYYEKCSCPDESTCPIRSIMKDVRDKIAKTLESMTVSHLCERARTLKATQSEPLDFDI
jgi:Rrf2 family protein